MKIETNEQYFEVAEKIEGHLHKATAQGGFATFTADENAELQALTVAAADYEKRIKLVPTPPTADPARNAEPENVPDAPFAKTTGGLAGGTGEPHIRTDEGQTPPYFAAGEETAQNAVH